MLKTFSMGVRSNLLLLALYSLLIAPLPGSSERFLVDYSSHPGTSGWEGIDRVILDPSAEVKLPAPGERDQPVFYAYLSLVEVAADATYAKEARGEKLLLENLNNEVWNSALADISNPAWHDFLVKRVAQPALNKGYQGFFLDTADSLYRLPDAENATKRSVYEKQVATIIVKLRTAFPDAPLILNRGFGVVDHLPKESLHGVLLESLYQTYDHTAKKYSAVVESDTAALESRIEMLRKRGLPIYVIDYVSPTDPELAAATAKRIEKLGASPLITTPNLQGMVLAPSTPVSRKIMVLYGSAPTLTLGDPKFVPDTNIARHFQAPLEWMGYELRFHNVSKGRPAELSPDEFSGVMVESDVQLTPSDEAWYVDWLLRRREAGAKLFFAGAIPFVQAKSRERILKGLGIAGTGNLVKGPQEVEIVRKESLFEYEAKTRPMRRGFLDLAAPRDAKVLLRLEGRDGRGQKISFDAAFVADWGGALFDPYWRFQPYSKDTLSCVDPYKLLGMIWPSGKFPAPDVTTRQGLRLFWAHVDGDAFATLSTIKRNATCAEIVRDHILKKYPLPTTISVIEAEIRSIQDTQNPEDAPRYEAIAREIFELPHVEAGSHAYSHPFVWSEDDIGQQDYYDRRHLHLKANHRFDKVDPRREIAGSVKYIESALLPPGKRVEIMLWTGNCRPFAEALRVCREIGIEAMNGGFTIYSPRHPQNSAIAPRVTWWGDELQVYTANQNEFVYTDDWSGPTFGGFEQVIRSFEMLESPRRMKPVNIYYHFYSAVFPSSLKALERVYDWSMEQPLHAVTASEASRITRDAVHTRIFQTGPMRWLIHNKGHLTTLRIPSNLGYPDLSASSNVLGFNDHEGERYLETNGSPVVELVLGKERPKQLFLRSSEAALKFSALAHNHCSFTAHAYQPSEVIFGGAEPGSAFTVAVTQPERPTQFENLRAQGDGRLVFTLPASAKVSLSPAASTTASR